MNKSCGKKNKQVYPHLLVGLSPFIPFVPNLLISYYNQKEFKEDCIANGTPYVEIDDEYNLNKILEAFC